ncbi:MAG TPA: TlpA disulfide reductase family protein [Gammaproteobacteria bacterium]
MKLKELTTALFILLLLGGAAFLWLSPSGLQPAPAVTVTTLEGKEVSLASLRDRPVLVTFWATTCPGCIKEIPHLVDLYRELGPQGLEIVAIAMAYDPPEQVRELARQKQLPYIVALDADGYAAKAFGEVKLTPTSFLLDPQGHIVQQKLGEMDMTQLRARILEMLAQKGSHA